MLGDKLGWNWLTYNPGVYFEFAVMARRNCAGFTNGIAKAFPKAKTICDVGAGTGQYLQGLQKLGRKVDGFEYSPMGRAFGRLIGVPLGEFDLCNEPSLPGAAKYDLAYSVEVGEHIPTFLSEQFVKTLTGLAPTVFVTCAQPGQQGHGHINCQPKSFWVDLFAKQGFSFNEEDTKRLLAEFAKFPDLSDYLSNNAMVFRKV